MPCIFCLFFCISTPMYDFAQKQFPSLQSVRVSLCFKIILVDINEEPLV